MTDRPEDIQTRLTGLDEIGQVVGALRAIAAGEVGAAHDAAEAVVAYAGTLSDALAAVTADASALPNGGRGKGLLLVVGAAQGFSGSYPARIAEAVRGAMESGCALVVVGQRTIEMLQGDGLPILWSADLPGHPVAVPDLASHVTDALVRLSIDHPGPIMALVAASEGNAPPELRNLLAPVAGRGTSRTAPPLTNLPLPELVAGLLQEALFAAVARALTEGVAAEAQARVEAMARAQRNLSTRRIEVERQLQQARQEQMTTEIIELVVSRPAG